MLREFEVRLLRGIFEPKWGEVRGEWIKQHSEKLSDLFTSTNIFRVFKSRRMIWTFHESCMGEKREEHRDLVGTSKGKRKLVSSRLIRIVNIQIDLQEFERLA